MGEYSTETSGGGPKFTGFVTVGPPFEILKEFHQPEGEWAKGRWNAVIRGTIQKPLPYPVYNYKGDEKHVAPEECVGHGVVFFMPHPKNNHVVGDEIDDYKYLATRWKFKRPWPNFTTDFLLSKVGATTKGLTTNDDERLLMEIVALLNTGNPFPVAMWDSKLADIERQIPRETEVLGHFHKFLYWDWKKGRPTWVAYEAEGREGNPYTFRDATFLLRVVAPDPWIGTLLRLSVNYTIWHGQKKSGESQWQSSPSAHFGDVMKEFGVEPEYFAKDVDESLLHEVEVGQPANWLGPLEVALQEMAERRFVHIAIPEKNILFRDVKKAAPMLVESITKQKDFMPPDLRSIKDLPEDQIVPPEEPIPGFGDEQSTKETLEPERILKIFDEYAGFDTWREVGGEYNITDEGKEWAVKYLVPVFAILDLDREYPFDGWDKNGVDRFSTLMTDKTFKQACESGNVGAAIKYGADLLDPPVKKDSGAAF